MNIEAQNNSNSTLISYIQVENTPFTLVKDEEKVAIVLGQHLVTHETFKTVDEAKKFINEKGWNLIMVACAIYTSEMIELAKQRDEQLKK